MGMLKRGFKGWKLVKEQEEIPVKQRPSQAQQLTSSIKVSTVPVVIAISTVPVLIAIPVAVSSSFVTIIVTPRAISVTIRLVTVP